MSPACCTTAGASCVSLGLATDGGGTVQFEQQLSMLGKECDHRRFDIEDRNVREEILDRTADDTHIDARTQETFAISLGTLCAVAARSLELCWAYLSHDG